MQIPNVTTEAQAMQAVLDISARLRQQARQPFPTASPEQVEQIVDGQLETMLQNLKANGYGGQS